MIAKRRSKLMMMRIKEIMKGEEGEAYDETRKTKLPILVASRRRKLFHCLVLGLWV